jgi:lipopolysaccharide transport system permease protein
MAVTEMPSALEQTGDDETDETNVILIEPMRGWIGVNLREVWQYRELLYFFIWRDLKVRYKQTILGVIWVILQPVMTMVVMSIVFGRMARIPSEGIPYPIFAYSALLPWSFFAGGLGRAAGSMVGSANLLQKVYFPRLILPLAAVVGGLTDFFLEFIVLIGLMIYYNLYPTATSIWLLFPLLLLAGITALGVGLWTAAINVRYRDIRYIVPFLTQFWMYLTPVIYPASLVGSRWKVIYSLNPMVGVITGFRWALLGKGSPPGALIWVSAAGAIVILITGALYFRRMEKTFADVV